MRMEDSARTTLALRELLAWVQFNGGSAQLEFAHESCARKLVAKSTICGIVGGDTIFSIPTSCLLHPDSAKTDCVYGPAFTSLSAEPGVDDRIILTLFLALERERGVASKFAPYINALPAHVPVPLSWSDLELRHLEGTRLEHAVKQHRDALRQEIEVWTPLLLEHMRQNKSNSNSAGAQALAERALNAEQISWARSCVWSRAFSLYLNQSKTIALVPLGDMLDHSPEARVEWLTDDAAGTAGTFSIRSHEAISAGGEVFNNYGQKGNDELLLGYAFVTEDNKADTFRCDLQGSSHSARECRTRNLLLGHYGVTSTHYLRVDDPLPESLLLAAKIFSSSPALVYRLCSEVPSGKTPEEALAIHMPLDDLCTSLRALRSLHLLITGELKRLNKSGTSVESGCIEDEQKGFAARMSSVYRKSQTRIANMTLTAISLRVKSLLSDLSASVERYSTSDSDELYWKERQAYISWVSERGIQNSAVEEVSIRNCFGFTDGLRVTSLIAEGSFIGRVPVDALLVASDVFRELCSKFGEDAEQAALAATLLQSTLVGREQDFAPFVNWIMCAPVTAAAFNSDVLTILQGTAVGQDALGLRAEYEKEFEIIKTAVCLRSDQTQLNLSSLYARVRTLVERYAIRLPQFEREHEIPLAGCLALAPFIGFFPKALEDIAANLVWTHIKMMIPPTCEGKWHLELKSLCEMDPGTLLIEPTDGVDEGTQLLEIGTESLCSLMRECGENNLPSTSMPLTAQKANCLKFTSCHSVVELLLEPADEDENLRRRKLALLRFMGVGDSHYLSMVPNPEILCVALLVCSAENEAEVETLRTAWLTAVETYPSFERQVEDTTEVLQANRTDSSSCGAVSSDDRNYPSAEGKKDSFVESEDMFKNSAQSHDASSGIHLCTFQLAAKTLQLNRGISKNIKKVARTMLRSMVQQLPIPSSNDADIEICIRLGTRLEREASLQRAVASLYAVRQREILEKNVEALVRRLASETMKKRKGRSILPS